MEIKEIAKLCVAAFGGEPKHIERLAGAGSSRRYYRVTSGWGAEGPATCIATYGDDVAENRRFCTLARAFERRMEDCGDGVCRMPHIYGESADGHCYLQTDFGDTQLLDLIQDGRNADGYSTLDDALMHRVWKGLLILQTTAMARSEGSRPEAAFDRRRVMWDLNYFKYDFLKVCGVTFDEAALEEDFNRLADDIGAYPAAACGFMYRDFQSRNLMCIDSRPGDVPAWGFIDFQGGMRGPALYDAVSFLWQAKAAFEPRWRQRMLEAYIERLAMLTGCREDELRRAAPRFVTLRTLQVLGAYGFRGLIEHKAHFVESIPHALQNLRQLIEEGALDDYPELKRLSSEVCALKIFTPDEHPTLRVEVLSFSYKKGYPVNFTGNGGGFVFDCRGMHNPGRYAEYRPLTGYDAPVKRFLEEQGEVQKFVANAAGMVDPCVATYLRRGFRNLQVAFGCTGGRHRSVYCANAMAAHIKELYPAAEVRLIHREQGIDTMLD